MLAFRTSADIGNLPAERIDPFPETRTSRIRQSIMIEIQFDEMIDMKGTTAKLPAWQATLKALLSEAAAAALRMAAADPQVDLTIVMSDNARLQALNGQYLGIDAPTDVLSFPSGDTDPDTQAVYLGDILISYERAAEQAHAGGHTVESELQLLTVHGVLHLLGNDHAEEDEKAVMWALQTRILEAIGCPLRP